MTYRYYKSRERLTNKTLAAFDREIQEFSEAHRDMIKIAIRINKMTIRDMRELLERDEIDDINEAYKGLLGPGKEFIRAADTALVAITTDDEDY